MKTQLLILSFILTLLALPATGQNYLSLDQSDPIAFYGNRIVYGGEEIELNERTLFVDGHLSADEAALYPYVYASFQEAVHHLKNGTESEPMRLYIAPYVYWIDNPDDPTVRKGKDGREPFGMVVKCDYLHLIGLTQNPRSVVLAANRGQTQGAVGNFTMFDFWGDGLLVKNLTMGNFCNVDLVYPLKPTLGRAKRMSAITQAHVAYSHGDKVMAENVHFISRLNMNPLNGARRILFKDCHLESTDDALTGNGVYLGCTLHLYAPRPFWCTDSGGAVFLDCDFTVCHEDKRQYFCKSVGPLSLIDCRFHAPSDSIYIGWTAHPTDWLRCYVSGVTLNGNPYQVGLDKPANTVELADKFALNAYYIKRDGKKLYNTYNLLRGEDDWDPLLQKPLIGEYADMATCLALSPQKATLQTGDSALTLTATLKRHSNYTLNNRPLTWSVSPGDEDVVRLSTTHGYSCEVQANYHDDSSRKVSVIASTEDGLQCATELTLLPDYLPSPHFTLPPSLSISRDTLWLDYRLELKERDDQSLVTWYRCKDSSGSDALPRAVSRFDRPMWAYPLTCDDNGYYMMATIQPKHCRSLPGDTVSIVTSNPIAVVAEAPIAVLQTDFQNFSTTNQPHIIPGFWSVGGYKPIDTNEYDWEVYPEEPYWYYGEGINGAKGLGLLQCQRGARLLYTPLSANYGDMCFELLVDPCKTAGQGFGSATGQYMDIYIKMDTKTLTGYALRIERTTKYSNAVDFRLMHYVDGVPTSISEPVSAICYRTGCTIRLSAEGDRLKATVRTSTPLAVPNDSNLHTEVYLEAPMVSTNFGGIGIQHTGTWGENATQLKQLKVEWRP